MEGKKEELGFQLSERRSRKVPPADVTDLRFADNIALKIELIEQAQEVLTLVEESAKTVRLIMNARK